MKLCLLFISAVVFIHFEFEYVGDIYKLVAVFYGVFSCFCNYYVSFGFVSCIVKLTFAN